MKTAKVRKPAKKRKIASIVDSGGNNDEPVQKKSKKKVIVNKKALSEGDEQWKKFIKVQSGTLSGTNNKKNKMTTTTTSTSGEKKSINAAANAKSKEEKKKKKKISSLFKHREPCDLMRNEARSQELANQITPIEEITAENHEQMTLAIHLMPERSRQTAETLALGIEQYDVPPMSFNDVEFSLAMKRQNYERTATDKGNERVFPLQDLMADQGFFSINNEHVEHVLKCIIKDKRNDIDYAKFNRSKTVKEASGSGGRSIVVAAGGGGGDISNKKLNHIFGNTYYSFGYNRRTPQLQDKKMKALDVIDREERFKLFYKFDQLEPVTEYGKMPTDSKMFRRLRRENGEKFARRGETLRKCASLTPKSDVEELSKEYILEFRLPPGTGDELCANGTRCVFNNSPDKTACYIGKVFYTEREKSGALRRQINGTNEVMGGNVARLCYDCLLKSWIFEWAMNIQNEVIPERPINYFTVECKPGQYSPHCMLSVVENDKPTGIVGHVPRFSLNNRRIVIYQRYRYCDNKHETFSVPVLVETGMDF